MCSAGSTRVDVCLVDVLLMSTMVAKTFDTPPVVVLKGDKVKKWTTLGHESAIEGSEVMKGEE